MYEQEKPKQTFSAPKSRPPDIRIWIVFEEISTFVLFLLDIDVYQKKKLFNGTLI